MDQTLVVNIGLLGVTAVGVLASIWQANEARRAKQGAEAAEQRANQIAVDVVLALREANNLTQERIPEIIQVRYENLLRALSPLSNETFADAGRALKRLKKVHFQMLLLGELMTDREPWVPVWLEAERQWSISRIGLVFRRLEEGQPPLSEAAGSDWMTTLAPFLRWVTEFGHNLRAWRGGAATNVELLEQAHRLEEALRKADQWMEAMPWRDDIKRSTVEKDS